MREPFRTIRIHLCGAGILSFTSLTRVFDLLRVVATDSIGCAALA
jgi:hypothetical protein